MAVNTEESVLAGLNARQKKAAQHNQGPLLIIAGAGTGKTRVITRRIAWLITTKKARPEEILALTFTDKAASEMEERVDLLVPYGYTDIWISTFHAFGDRILRENALELGLTPDFTVLTRPEQLIFLKEHLYEFNLDYYRPKSDPAHFLQALVVLFSRLRDEDISCEEYLRYAERLKQEAEENPQDEELKETAPLQRELAGAYATYQDLLLKEGKVDFGNQVYLALQLFRERPLVLKHYQRQFKYILVDEFQDTNYSQFQLVKLLSQGHQNIVVVGDDNQSIFKFRGAAISNILNFMDYFPRAEKIVLTDNYRSTQPILEKAYQLIKYNDPDTLEVKCGISKQLVSHEPRGPEIKHLHFDTAQAEADEVARLIEEKQKKGIPFGEIAVLVRSNNDAQSFLRALNMRSIPWRFSGNQGLYSREEIRFLIAFLRAVADPDDSISLYLLVSFCELYNMDMPDLTRCLNQARKTNRSLFSVFSRVDEIEEFACALPEKTRDTIRKVIDDITRYLKQARTLSTGRLLYLFLQETGFIKKLLREESLENEQRLKNIARFFNIVANFENLARVDRLPNFIRHLDMLISSGDDPATAEAEMDLDAVNILTVHKAKGLEFSLVFMVNLVQGRFPWPRRREALELPLDLVKDILPGGDYHIQEERRLFYVGMTRARKELYFTSGVDYGGKRARKPSQFIYEALGISPQKPEIIKARAVQDIERYAPPASAPVVQERPMGADELLFLSFRQIDDYLSCPLKYKYVHILRIPIMRHHSVVYGSAIHKAIVDFYRARTDKRQFTQDDLLKGFKRSWVNEGFLSRAHEEQRFAQGELTLKHFYEREKSRPAPACVEQPFNFILDKNKIVGRWDRVDLTPEGAVIIDFKTSDKIKQQKQADKRVKDTLQLSIYALAYNIIEGELPARVELHFVDTGLVGSGRPTPGDMEETREKIRDVARGIRAREFTARPDYFACSYCAYREVCPEK